MHWRAPNKRKVVYPLDDNPLPLPKYPPMYWRGTQRVRSVVGTWLFVIAVVFAIAIGLAINARSQSAWLKSWIPANCCVTNDCCWQITEREVRPRDGGQWEVRSTGQVLPYRKPPDYWDYSPDGKFYRCACDYDAENKQWVRHQGAHTRCLFTPMRTTEVRR